MKVYVHIGSDKTGTTAIQAILKKNRKYLKENGVVYPELSKAPHHEALARELLAGKKGSAWEALEKILATRPEHLIISSEMFCGISEVSVQKLKQWLGNHDLIIIAYLRSADQYLESGVMQRLKASQSEKDFLRLYRKIKWIPAIFNPMVYISGLTPRFVFKWAKAFGVENVEVRPYCETQWKGKSLVDDFMATLGLAWLTEGLQDPAQKRNITLNIYAVYAISSFWKSTHPPLQNQFSEVMAHQHNQTKNLPVCSYFKRYLAQIISWPTFSRISRDFGCPPPIPDNTNLSNHTPSEREVAQQAQKLLIEFSIHQRKRIKTLERKLRAANSGPQTSKPSLAKKHEPINEQP